MMAFVADRAPLTVSKVDRSPPLGDHPRAAIRDQPKTATNPSMCNGDRDLDIKRNPIATDRGMRKSSRLGKRARGGRSRRGQLRFLWITSGAAVLDDGRQSTRPTVCGDVSFRPFPGLPHAVHRKNRGARTGPTARPDDDCVVASEMHGPLT